MYYTYLLGWTQQDKYYYGVRYSKKAKLEDIGSTYMSSSKYVKLFIEKHGEPNLIEIRKVFKDKNSALLWETKVLKKLNIPNNKKYLNRWNNNMVPLNIEGPFPFEFDKVQEKVNTKLIEKYGSRGSGSKIIKDKIYKTNIKKYGKHHTLDLDIVKTPRQNSIETIYGTDNPFKNPKKLSEVMFDKHGVTNMMFDKKTKETHKKVMEEKDWTDRNFKSKKTNIEKYGVDCAMNDKNKYRACPFDCNNNKKYNLGNFSKHMIQYHNWDKPQIKEYKIEN